MTGIGSAYYLILWGRRFATLDNDSIIINSAASIVIGFFLYALVIQNLPTEIGVVISGALPLAELFVWNLAKSKSASQKSASDLLKYLPLKRSAVLVRFGIPIALFGLALGFIRTVSTEYITALSSFGATVTIVLTVCAAVLLTIFLYVSLAESSRWNSIFKLIVPCIAVAVFCVPLMYKEPYELTALIVVAGFVLFECIMWIYFGFIAQKFNLSPVLIYGVGRGVLAFFSLVGSIFWQLDTVELLGLNTDVKMSAVLVILIFAYIALPDRRSVEQMRKHALIPKEAPIDLDGEGASAPALAQNEGQIEGVSSGEQASIESSAASLDAPVPANLPPSTSTPSPKIDRMPQQIEVLANTYLLSRREVEVLECLARGHNAAYICKHLYIAEGTAKTHIRHIYRKLNVHSLHELIELVEQTETVIG
jgi:DNA-binding CsgD family transcriptional regulator